MNNDIMVTVVCPTYNQGKYLRQGLDSILMQRTNFKYEVLIGEDCSPDNTNEILKEYEASHGDIIQIFHREQNLKQSRNVYDLFMRSKGKYIIILDLDDYWTDECKLQKQVDFLETHPEYIGVSHDYMLVDSKGNEIIREGRVIKQYLGKAFTLNDFLEEGFVYQTGTFCYRNIWLEDRDWSILYKSDRTVVDLTINSILLLRQNIFILPECMSVYRDIVNDSALNYRSVCAKDRGLDWKAMSEQYEKLNEFFDGKIDYSLMWCNVVLSYLKAMLKHEPGTFRFATWMKMYKNSTPATKKKIKEELWCSLKRKLS